MVKSNTFLIIKYISLILLSFQYQIYLGIPVLVGGNRNFQEYQGVISNGGAYTRGHRSSFLKVYLLIRNKQQS